MKVIFCGDKPSKTNTSYYIAFVGAKCWPRLKAWIQELELHFDDILLINTNTQINISMARDFSLIDYKIIAVGSEASKRLTEAKVTHYKIDHPSGLNRKLNDKKYVTQMLKDCYSWLYSKPKTREITNARRVKKTK